MLSGKVTLQVQRNISAESDITICNFYKPKHDCPFSDPFMSKD